MNRLFPSYGKITEKYCSMLYLQCDYVFSNNVQFLCIQRRAYFNIESIQLSLLLEKATALYTRHNKLIQDIEECQLNAYAVCMY